MSTSMGRQSMAASDEDIIQIYEQCVKLSVNNKINPSNAFSLKLIDYMPLLAKPKPGQLVDFKVVSSALLAASKIYRCRVKHVYDEAHRIAAYLNIALIKDKDGKGGRPLDGTGDPDDDDEGASEEPGNRAKKRKIARKTVKTIASNLDTISINSVECIVPPDPLFAQLSAAFDIGSCKGLLTTNLNHEAGTGLLMLTGTKFSSDPDDFSEYFDRDQQTLMNELKTITESKSKLVPALAKFEFLVRDADANVSLSTMRNASDTMDRLTPFEEYHMNDTGVNSPCSDLVDDAVMSERGSEEGDQPQENTIVENFDPIQNLVKLDTESASDYLLKVLTVDDQSEYTTPFHKTFEGAWAGPQFIKPCVNRKKSQALMRSPKKSKAHFEEIDFSQPLPEKETADANTVLKFNTLNKWPERLLPIDISYDPMSLLKPFLKENATFSALKVIGPDTATNGQSEDAEDADLDHHDSYDEYENFPPASQFPLQGFSQDPGGSNHIDDDLIAEPFKISSTHLPYPKVAKRIDIIKLKKEMWSMVNIEGCGESGESFPGVQAESPVKETETQSMEENPDTNANSKSLPFSDLYKKLPEKVGNMMAKNLSVPIAFVALLHLTNEKNLMLESRTDLSDFIIKAPPDN
ncbi:non-SMC condensin I complex subunit H [Brevipalpus obovatus]|uniref:non-SMC condensin I complex subunit H n=1 Tax=Brevipalpus obovatus TaxID=246614 RepID=UPI003D9DD2D2